MFFHETRARAGAIRAGKYAKKTYQDARRDADRASRPRTTSDAAWDMTLAIMHERLAVNRETDCKLTIPEIDALIIEGNTSPVASTLRRLNAEPFRRSRVPP
jgi:hypothetical protein